MATKKKTSSAKAFKKKTKDGAVDLTVPSGEVCQAKRPGMESMLKTGRVPNALMPVIQEAMEKSQGGKKLTPDDIDMKDFASSPERLASMFEFMDVMVMEAVIEPKIHPVPEDEAERDDELLYIDELDEMDKSFIFQWAVGGSADLKKFRQGLADELAHLAPGEAVRG